MNISLPKGLQQFVREQVESGMYDSCSEVHRDGLRLLKAQKERERLALEELRRELAFGVEQLQKGEGVSFNVADIVREGKQNKRGA